MTQPGDPPTSPGSGRSIYERLGLTPMKDVPPRRPIPARPAPAPMGPGRGTLRYLIGIPLILVALAFLWLNLPAGGSRPASSLVGSGNDEDERRADAQDAKIKQLETRIEVLEIKMRAMQKVDGYRAALAQQPAPRSAESSAAD